MLRRWLFAQPLPGRQPVHRCLYCAGEARRIPDDCLIAATFQEQVADAALARTRRAYGVDWYTERALDLRACAWGHFTAHWTLRSVHGIYGAEFDDSEDE